MKKTKYKYGGGVLSNKIIKNAANDSNLYE